MNTNNTDKPMELKELPVNPCNNCENPNQMRDKRCGNCRFNAGVNYAIKTIVPQAIQATREENLSRDKCWEYTGRIQPDGYGQICLKGKNFYVHRLSWSIFHGKQPTKTKELDHLCRNRKCFNPNHLELVTQYENFIRGESPLAKFARSTCCAKGHEYTAESTYIYKRYRVCKICRRNYDKNFRVRRDSLTNKSEK